MANVGVAEEAAGGEVGGPRPHADRPVVLNWGRRRGLPCGAGERLAVCGGRSTTSPGRLGCLLFALGIAHCLPACSPPKSGVAMGQGELQGGKSGERRRLVGQQPSQPDSQRNQWDRPPARKVQLHFAPHCVMLVTRPWQTVGPVPISFRAHSGTRGPGSPPAGQEDELVVADGGGRRGAGEAEVRDAGVGDGRGVEEVRGDPAGRVCWHQLAFVRRQLWLLRSSWVRMVLKLILIFKRSLRLSFKIIVCVSLRCCSLSYSRLVSIFEIEFYWDSSLCWWAVCIWLC